MNVISYSNYAPENKNSYRLLLSRSQLLIFCLKTLPQQDHKALFSILYRHCFLAASAFCLLWSKMFNVCLYVFLFVFAVNVQLALVIKYLLKSKYKKEGSNLRNLGLQVAFRWGDQASAVCLIYFYGPAIQSKFSLDTEIQELEVSFY